MRLLSGLLLLAAFPLAGATIAGRVTDAETGQVVPCTVAIRAAVGPVLTDHPSFRDGIRSAGIFEQEVPAGETVVRITRGFDYEPIEQRVALAAGDRRELQFRLRRRSPLHRLGWVAGDSHVHMIHGERTIVVSFDDVARAARAEGLDYLSLCQRWNVPEETPEAIEPACLRAGTPDFTLTWNLEAPKNYWRGDVAHCAGHGWTLGMRGRTPDGRSAISELLDISAWDYESDKPPAPNFESHALIHTLGGIVSYTHPHRWHLGKWGGRGIYPIDEKHFISNLAQELPFDTVAGPTYDMLDIMMQPHERDVNRQGQELWFMLLNHGYRIPATASSDTTFDNPGGGVPGKVRVYTLTGGDRSPAAVADAVKAGRNFVTSGPLLLLEIGNRQVGDVVRAPARLNARVRAWGASKVEIVRNGEVVRKFSGEGGAFRVEEPGTAWYIARAYGAAEGEVAVTNPIYFEGADYRAPQPAPAHVEAVITGDGGKPLSGTCEVIRMVGRDAMRESEVPFQDGRLSLIVPATARLRVRSAGYAPVTKSIFMDYAPLLDAMLNMRAEGLSDWGMYEKMRTLLGGVKLEFRLPPQQ